MEKEVALYDSESKLLLDVFYAVNKAQHFEFPHNNCDVCSKDELAKLYFKQSGFGSYCCCVIASINKKVCDLSIMQQNSQFVNFVTAWMRLKFIAEQVDPVRYRQYFDRLPIPANKTPKLPVELLELYKADSTEFYTLVDRLANKIQIQWIGMLMASLSMNGDCDLELDNVCTLINSELPTIRGHDSATAFDAFAVFDPYELSIRPFLEYQRELRRILLRLDGCSLLL
jgi:hypothetical protein